MRGAGVAAEPYVRRLADLYRRVFAVDPFTDDDGRRGGAAPDRDSAVSPSCAVHDSSGPATGAGDPVTFLVVEGLSAAPMVSHEIGTHLVVDGRGGLVPVQVARLPAGRPDDAGGTAALRARFDDARRAWRERVDRGEAAPDDDPFPWGPVVRIYDERAATVDLRTRTSVAGWPGEGDLLTFIAAGLPVGGEAD